MPDGYQAIQLLLTGLVFPGIYLFVRQWEKKHEAQNDRITSIEEKIAALFERRETDKEYLHSTFIMREDFYRVVAELKQTIAASHVETRDAIRHREAQVNNLSSEIFSRLGKLSKSIDQHIGEKHDEKG